MVVAIVFEVQKKRTMMKSKTNKKRLSDWIMLSRVSKPSWLVLAALMPFSPRKVSWYYLARMESEFPIVKKNSIESY